MKTQKPKTKSKTVLVNSRSLYLLTMKVMLCLVLLAMLTSCNDVPKAQDSIQKQIRLVLEIDPDTGRRYINEEESRCFFRTYRYSVDYIGAVGDAQEEDVSECNKIIGWRPKEYEKVTEYHERVRVLIQKELNEDQ